MDQIIQIALSTIKIDLHPLEQCENVNRLTSVTRPSILAKHIHSRV